jgi:hypothetical protein
VPETIDSKTRIFLHFAGESVLERTRRTRRCRVGARSSCWSSRGQRRSLLTRMRASQCDFVGQGTAFRLNQRHVWTAAPTASPVRFVVMVPSPSFTEKGWLGLRGHRDSGCNPAREDPGEPRDFVICGLLRTDGSLRRSIVMLPLQGAERPQSRTGAYDPWSARAGAEGAKPHWPTQQRVTARLRESPHRRSRRSLLKSSARP